MSLYRKRESVCVCVQEREREREFEREREYFVSLVSVISAVCYYACFRERREILIKEDYVA